jgi:hypothetical protein
MPYYCIIYAILGCETCSLADTYKRFEGIFCLHLQERNGDTSTSETSVFLYQLYDDLTSHKYINFVFTVIKTSTLTRYSS